LLARGHSGYSRSACKLGTGYTLLIAEKPKAAARIAQALGARVRCSSGRASYYIGGNGSLIIASAAGHLYGLYTREKSYPVFEYEWVPIHEYDRSARYLKPYYNLLSRLARNASLYVNACDYDIEGSVIGYLIIAKMGDPNKARRMKYSTLTPSELREAWRRLEPLDREMVEAGIARHEVDWLWGINISRALMDLARKASGRRIILSAGRVQSPTLVKAYKDWLERALYIPDPQFDVLVTLEKNGVRFAASHKSPLLWNRRDAQVLARRVEEDGRLRVVYVERYPYERRPPPAFNLPDLQAEASRIYGYAPSETQKLAEDLYLAAAISYPRTNSQKLPPSINYKGLIERLGRLRDYSSIASELLARDKLIPVQGAKEDPAHPAIYPTGYPPKDLTPRHYKIYDLIVRRFLAAFHDNARLVKTTVELVELRGIHRFQAQGTVVTSPGWLSVYHYSMPEEKIIPPLTVGEEVKVVNAKVKTTWQKPPGLPIKKINLVKWMEKVGIGTEATRARIVDTLYKRGYLSKARGEDEVTSLGASVARLLMSTFPQLSTPDLTRRLEEELESIRAGRKQRVTVVLETRRLITDLLDSYREILESPELDRIAVESGLREASVKCSICGQPGIYEVNGVRLCRNHYEALKRLKVKLPVLQEKLGLGASATLRSVASASGKYVKEVARAALKDDRILRALSPEAQ
jgi:DNA topoisomerase-1